jgi:two-component system cell cycle sensor histidine kinase/response regulator CckA
MKKEKRRSGVVSGLKNPGESQLPGNRVATVPPRKKEETLRLINELEMQRIELKKQNAQLQKTREKLETTLAKYADLYDFSPAAYFTLASNGVILEVNLAGSSLLGIGRSRLVGRYFQHFVADKERTAFTAYLDRVFSSKAKLSYEVPLVKMGQSECFALIDAVAGRSSHDCRLAVIDITEKKQTEYSIRLHNLRYQMVLEDQTEVICRLKADGTFTFVNDVYCRFFGKTKDELLGKRWHPVALTEDIPMIEERLAALSPANPLVTIENRVYSVSGEIRWMQFVNRGFFDDDGHLLEIQSVGRDISDRKRVEESLCDSEERYRKLFYTETDALFLIDQETYRFLDVNPAALELYGYSFEEFLHLTAADISAEPEKTRQAIATGQTRVSTRLHRKKDGTIFPVEISASKYDYNGRKVHVAAMRDITERDRMERIMQARLRLLQLANSYSLKELLQATLGELETLTGSSISFYHFVEADQKTLSLQAWSKKTLSEFCKVEGKGRHYDIAEAGVWVDALLERRPIIHNGYSSLPHRRGLPPGHAEVVRELVVPIIRGGRIVAILGVGNKQDDYNEHDVDTVTLLADMAWGIVKCKLAENESLAAKVKCERFFKLIPVLVCIASIDGYFRNLNPAWERTLGHTVEELQNAPFFEFIHPEDLAQNVREVERLTHGESTLNFKNRYRHRDGSYRWLEWVALHVKEDGVIYATARDITEIIRLEEEAKLTQARLIQANKMSSLGLIASGVAHEINNPNNYILTNATLLADAWQAAAPILEEYYRENGDFSLGNLQYSSIRDNAPRLFTGLVEGAKRIRRIVDRIKDFTRQGTEITNEAFDVNKVILDAMAILDHEIKNCCENFRNEALPGLPPALGNVQQIGQVMINLLVNSLQALPDRRHGIRIATGVSEDGEHIFIKVEDEGVGIPPEELERICDPFFTTKRATGGTGLGLSISASILKENQGMLSFASEPGRGTTATVLLRRPNKKEEQ